MGLFSHESKYDSPNLHGKHHGFLGLESHDVHRESLKRMPV
jgi:hypothetical protein